MYQIIVIVATKNRLNFLTKTLLSIQQQTLSPFKVIVVSNSKQELSSQEEKLCNSYNYTYYYNQNANSYASNLNYAIMHYLSEHLSNNIIDFNNQYIAFLDDDDYWENNYLAKCYSRIKDDVDFIYAGLKYLQNDEIKLLSIPKKLDEQTFLAKNPHIQGSNTFIKLTTLLKAGCFDENMHATTDRDLFSRVMLLKPKYKRINEHLVFVNAQNDHERLTTSLNIKQDSLCKFFSKYGGLMNKETKNVFFSRINNLFKLKQFNQKSIISYFLNKNQLINETNKVIVQKTSQVSFNKKVVFGCISTDFGLIKRVIKAIVKNNLKQKSLVLFVNCQINKKQLMQYIKQFDLEVHFIFLEEVYSNIKQNLYGSFIDPIILNQSYVNNISYARIILNYHLKQVLKQDDVVWIIDDDMEFYHLIYTNHKFKKINIDLNSILIKYDNHYDAVIGSYDQDPPLPTLSFLRTSLLDFTYANKLNKNKLYDESIYFSNDYYYDLAQTLTHLETPLKLFQKISLDDVFSTKAYTRKLFHNQLKEFKPYSRGGNTIIFNHALLDIPNISININSLVARRSDYFWILIALNVKKYNIIATNFALLHNRKKTKFDYFAAINKEIKDLIGSSFTKSLQNQNIQTISAQQFITLFKTFLLNRLSLLCMNYYRIIGLLQINQTKKYLSFFNQNNLNQLIHETKKYLNEDALKIAFNNIKQQLNTYLISCNQQQWIDWTEQTFHTKITKVLGFGQEAIVLCDDHFVYKVFYHKNDFSYLKTKIHTFKQCKALFDIEIIDNQKYDVIKYQYVEQWSIYEGQNALQIIELIQFLKTQNLVFNNFKLSNFILINNQQIKLVDYGKDLIPFNQEIYERSLIRAFQMLKYHNLSRNEFQAIINKSYAKQDQDINFLYPNFLKLFNVNTKEENHDKLILNIIKNTKYENVFDYGCGKCKIVNQLNKTKKISVYDINYDLVVQRAKDHVEIVQDLNKVKNKYDLILCNLVLCCTNNKTNHMILNNIKKIAKHNSKIIISICNPFFDDLKQTHLNKNGYNKDYTKNNTWIKQTIYDSEHKEYHRSFGYYENLLKRHHFKINQVMESDYVNNQTFNDSSEYLVFECSYEPKVVLDDCTLLIKTNPMEHHQIEQQVKSIVNNLCTKTTFNKIVVVVDDIKKAKRNRRYAKDDLKDLLKKLKVLKDALYIDEIVLASKYLKNKKTIYAKYFEQIAQDCYTTNNQQIFSTLVGFEVTQTPFVFQTDADIVYVIKDNAINDAYELIKKENALSVCLSIKQQKLEKESIEYGKRIEVRSCFLNLKKLKTYLPLKNTLKNKKYELTWNKALDQTISLKDSIRLKQNKSFFIHPSNELKTNNFLAIVRSYLEQNNQVHKEQDQKVDLVNDLNLWTKKIKNKVILYLRGYNVSCEKTKRLLSSLKQQTFQDFFIVYVDDASCYKDQEYLLSLFKYNEYLKHKVYYILNNFRVGSLVNFDVINKYVFFNDKSIIINIDADDCLITKDALELIVNEFTNNKHDVAIGNAFNARMPLNVYKFNSFKEVWKRDGDNVWVHPKCFLRKLCKNIDDFLFYRNKYIDVNTDLCVMFPVINRSTNPLFITKNLYYFEPSLDNFFHKNQYEVKHRREIKQHLLKQAEIDYKKLNEKKIKIINQKFYL